MRIIHTTELITVDPNEPPFYHYPVAENVIVAHNTAIDSGKGIIIGQGGSGMVPRNLKIHANILLRTDGACLITKQAGSNIKHSDNLCYGGTSAPNQAGFSNFNPGLGVDGRGIFRPSAGSRAVDAASTVLISGLKDMDGQARSGSHDLGADEYVSGTTGKGPIEICDTGPRTYQNGGACTNRPAPLPPTSLTVM